MYRRTLPDGQDFVVRLSTEPYATVFRLSWTAPTGSAKRCLGDHAVFLGVPGDIGSWGPAWVAAPWFDAAVPTQPAVLLSSMWAAEDTVPATELLVVRTVDPTAAVAQISQRHALLVDRSVPLDRRPADLLDDDTGVQAAIAALDDSPALPVCAEPADDRAALDAGVGGGVAGVGEPSDAVHGQRRLPSALPVLRIHEGG